jgi:four helix bundle protein
MDEVQPKIKPLNKVATFEDLEVWQTARQVRKQLYQVVEQLPDEERYNLASQMRRAAVSLTANIAEGYGRYHFKENIQCCRIARGSAYELIDHLITCQDQCHVPTERVMELRVALFSVIRLLNGYIRSIAAHAKKADDKA